MGYIGSQVDPANNQYNLRGAGRRRKLGTEVHMAAWQRIGFLWLIAGAAQMSLRASEASGPLAAELIRTMNADIQATELVEKQILDRCRVENCDADLRECLLKIDRNFLMYRLARFAMRELTPEEMAAATTYFRTETGEKHRQVMRKDLGLSKATLSDQTPEVRAAMLAFLDTPAGYRLVTRALLTNSDEVRGMISSQARDAFYRCRPEIAVK